jgi:UDP-2,3-diacylglucosamine pyrophosphatase LpxH
MQKTYRSIFISDVHLGVKDCKAEALNNFLKHNTCDILYLVGDIIDGWKVQQNKLRWKQSHTNVVRRILGHAKRDTRVVYVAGNHDEFLRPMIPYGLSFGSVEICLDYPRHRVVSASERWTWASCWKIFRENLIDLQ